jgi:hypothetical protein
MHIERNHNISEREAIRKIDTFMDELIQRDFPGGVVIKDPSKSWSGNTMDFSFKAKKGWVGTTISGSIRVTDQFVVVDSVLPALIRTFVSEGKIRDVFANQFDRLFGV